MHFLVYLINRGLSSFHQKKKKIKPHHQRKPHHQKTITKEKTLTTTGLHHSKDYHQRKTPHHQRTPPPKEYSTNKNTAPCCHSSVRPILYFKLFFIFCIFYSFIILYYIHPHPLFFSHFPSPTIHQTLNLPFQPPD